MRRFFRPVVLCAALASSAAAAPAYAQSDADRATARTLATDGHKAFTEKKWTEAIDMFTRAEALVHAPPHLLYIARAQLELGHLIKAQEAYLKITREEQPASAPKPFRDAHADAEKELDALGKRIPMLKVNVEGAGEKKPAVTIDGVPMNPVLVGVSQPVDPGTKKVLATADGMESEPVSVDIKEGTKETVVLVLKPKAAVVTPPVTTTPTETTTSDKPSSGGTRTLGYVATGVGAVGLVVGTIFMFQNRSARDDADALCPGGVCPRSKRAEIESLDSDADSAGTISLVSFVVGGILVATGITMIATGGPKKTSRPFVTPVFGLGGAGLSGRF
jgi:hypothetical protein